MKKKFKALISIMLVVIIALSQTTVAFASQSATPVVLVHGMGSFAIYENPNTSSEKKLGSFSINDLLGPNGLVRKLLRVANGENLDPQVMIDTMKDFIEPFNAIGCDSNGNPVGNTGIASYWTDSLANHTNWLTCMDNNEPGIYHQICDRVGANNVYAFNYDWRLDAVENAKKLNTFIENVKSQTGKSKVTLMGGSEGTVVVSAYIDMYKNKNDLEKVIMLDGAFYGVGVTKAFKQDLYINSDVIQDYLDQFLLTYNGKELNTAPLVIISAIFTKAITNLSKYLNQVASNPTLLNSVYTEVLPLFSTIPILWEFIPYDDFMPAVNKMAQIGFLDTNSGLYTKIMNYHNIQGRVASNLKALKNKGVQVAVVANYGTPGIPVTSAYKNHTDILIDTKYASGGATVADYGTKLNKSGKYVSDDKIIDASTCILPDSTWFIKSIQHMNYWYGTEATAFLADLIATDKPLTISSMQKAYGYTQFMGTDRDQNIVSVLECGTDAEGTAKPIISRQPSTSNGLGAQNQTKSPETSSERYVAPLIFIVAGLGVFVISIRKKQTA